MPLIKSSSKQAVGENISRERGAGKPQRQAVAIALNIQRQAKKEHMKRGGSFVHPPVNDFGGLIQSSVPGRTDRIPMHVRNNSYVIPADVVSSLGEGNSLAGAKALDNLLHSGPYGTSLKRARVHKPHFADGGRTTPIIAAGGEYTVLPDAVERIGGGDMARGHKVLDEFVKHVRANAIKKMRSLPGPKKS